MLTFILIGSIAIMAITMVMFSGPYISALPMSEWEHVVLSVLKGDGWHYNHRDKSLIHDSGLVIVVDNSLPDVKYHMKYPAVFSVRNGTLHRAISDKIKAVAVLYANSHEVERYSVMESNEDVVSVLRSSFPLKTFYKERPTILPHHRSGYLFEKTNDGWTVYSKDRYEQYWLPEKRT